MKLHLSLAAIAVVLIQPCTSNAGTPPSVEQSIYHPAPPFVDVKQSIYVRERERPLLPLITSASHSLVPFLIDMHNSGTVSGVRHVMDDTRYLLRLPPQASVGQSRFVDLEVYCWASDNENQLTFLIEWGDVSTLSRYTDSYVFVRRAGDWYFEKHGTVAPARWTQTERYFQRPCPRVGDAEFVTIAGK